MIIDFNNKKFKALSNSENGEVSEDTVFHYHQDMELIWADYSGGNVINGFLVGKIQGTNNLEFVYQHVNSKMEIMTGKCSSKASKDNAGKIVLEEEWQWTCNNFSKGKSRLIEL
jgi:hypothetical protein